MIVESIREYWDAVVTNPYARAAIVFTGSLVVAKVVEVVLARFVTRLTRKTRTDLDDRVLQVLRRPVFLTIVWCGLYLALLGLDLPDRAVYWTGGLLQTLIVLQWTVALMRICRGVLEALSGTGGRAWLQPRTVPLFDNLVKLGLVGGALYFLLQAWNLDVAPWLASAGIAGLALGFAAKDSLANLFGGLFILVDAPYSIGDWINLDSGERGQVTAIGLRSTRLLTRDDVEVTVPNAVIANAKIANESGGPHEKARITVRVGVAYGTDVDRLEAILLDCARDVELVLGDPAPRVRFTEFGDSALVFRLLCWVDRPVDRGRALHLLNTAVYRAFAREGVEIPFPQRVVHLTEPGPGGPRPPGNPPGETS